MLRLSNLPLQGVILILGHLTVSQGLVCLFGGFLKSVQFFLCGLDLRLQRLIFLGKKVRIARIYLQELVDILQFGLRRPDFLVDIFKTGLELRAVPTKFDRDSFYPSNRQEYRLLLFAYFRAYFIAQIIAYFSPILLIK